MKLPKRIRFIEMGTRGEKVKRARGTRVNGPKAQGLPIPLLPFSLLPLS